MRDLRKGLPNGQYDVEAINRRMPLAYALFAVSLVVAVGTGVGLAALVLWVLR